MSVLVNAVPPPFPRRSVAGLPGDGGRYQIRDTIAQLRDMPGFLVHRRERFGPNFAFGAFGFVVFGVGEPELVRKIHLDADDDYSSRLGWHFSIGELFEGGLMLRDFSEHRRHRAMVQAAFRPSAMNGYLAIIDRCIQSALDDWAKLGRLHFYPAVKSLGLKVSLELILGIDAEDDAARRIGRAFHDAVQASVAAVRRPIPPLGYWRGLRGRRLLLRWFREEVVSRRRSPRTDIFSRLCATELSDEEIAQHLIFLVMAAHDTTASALTSCLWAACAYPEWQHRMREEVAASDVAPTRESLDQLEINDWVFKEAVRMHPPGAFMMRRTVRQTQLGSYVLPENLVLSPIAFITHFLPDWWTDPHRFDPDRFCPERSEHKRHPGLYYPFGGGAHHCLGIHLANLQARAFLHRFWQRFSVRSERPTRFRSIPIPYPVDGLPVRLTAERRAS